MYKVEYYNRKVRDNIGDWPVGIRADYFKIIDLIKSHGSNLGAPKTKYIDKGLFEIRAKGKEGIGRAFFCTQKGRKVVVLHSFIKKSQKTPNKDILLAKKRMKDI